MILEFAKLRGARIRCQSNIDFFFSLRKPCLALLAVAAKNSLFVFVERAAESG